MNKLALVAVLCALAPVSALAADLDDDGDASDRPAYGYEGPRYSDTYREPPRVPPPAAYDYRAPPPPPAGPYAYRPEPPYAAPPRYVEPPRYRVPPRYEEPDRGAYGRADACTGKDEIRQRLIGAGWSDFHDPVVEGPFATIKARRANGDLYELRVSRCSGDVVNTQFVGRARTYGPYASDDYYRPRWRRPYF